MTKGILNPEWELAKQIAQESGNESDANIKRIMREFKIVKRNEYTLPVAVACWRWLRTREKFPIKEARITTILLGSPIYTEQFKEALLETEMPPVYQVTAHDSYVIRNAEALAFYGFVYKPENWPHRLTTERLIEIGLKKREENE